MITISPTTAIRMQANAVRWAIADDSRQRCRGILGPYGRRCRRPWYDEDDDENYRIAYRRRSRSVVDRADPYHSSRCSCWLWSSSRDAAVDRSRGGCTGTPRAGHITAASRPADPAGPTPMRSNANERYASRSLAPLVAALYRCTACDRRRRLVITRRL